MEETKTVEEILQAATLLTKGIRLNKEGAEYKIMIKAMEDYKNQELTQQQEVNAELKKQNEDLVGALRLMLGRFELLTGYGEIKDKEAVDAAYEALKHTT